MRGRPLSPNSGVADGAAAGRSVKVLRQCAARKIERLRQLADQCQRRQALMRLTWTGEAEGFGMARQHAVVAAHQPIVDLLAGGIVLTRGGVGSP
ncbi:hypothetical protein EIO60_00050|nr:hypothetical protein [Candidatus Pantoea persica]